MDYQTFMRQAYAELEEYRPAVIKYRIIKWKMDAINQQPPPMHEELEMLATEALLPEIETAESAQDWVSLVQNFIGELRDQVDKIWGLAENNPHHPKKIDIDKILEEVRRHPDCKTGCACHCHRGNYGNTE